jgi:SPP1 family predicted phage head-tail adaptor
MRTGELDRRLKFQEPDRTQATDGQKVPTWTDISTVPDMWCKVSTPMGGRGSMEDYEADQLTATTVTLFTIRYRSDITQQMRIVFEGSNYDILTIEEVTRRNYLIIKAEKKD